MEKNWCRSEHHTADLLLVSANVSTFQNLEYLRYLTNLMTAEYQDLATDMFERGLKDLSNKPMNNIISCLVDLVNNFQFGL